MIWTRFTDFMLGRRPRPRTSAPPVFRPVAQPRPAATRRLPRFKGTANDPDRSVRISGGPADQSRAKLQRAFTPSQPVNDMRMFAGRKAMLLSLIRAIEEQQFHVVVFGERGMGKTSLLHVFAQLAREARYIVRYTSCSETSEFDGTFRAIAADIPLLYHADFDPTSESAERGASLDELLPEKTVTVAQISELFTKLSGTRVIIVLDEFDRATSPDFKRSIAELIKSLSDQAIRVQIVIAGVAENLSELVEHIPSIRRNVLGVPVTTMERDEIVELIELGESVSGLSFTEAALDQIVDAAQGSPYVAGLIAQQAASAALDRKADTVEPQDVARSIERALSDIKVRISPRGQQPLTRIEDGRAIAVLAPLAREALRTFGHVGTSGGAEHPAIEQARQYGAIEPMTTESGPAFRFVDDGLALYLWLASRQQNVSG